MSAEGAGLALELLVALVVGHVAGAILVRPLVTRMAAASAGDGLGWRLLALAGELAQGVLPVALATSTTQSWWVGWAAGLGVLTGILWPVVPRLRHHGTGPGALGSSLAGILAGLALQAGLVAGLLGLAVGIVVRVVGGRRGQGGAERVGAGVALALYPMLVLVTAPESLHSPAVLALYGVAAVGWLLRPRNPAHPA